MKLPSINLMAIAIALAASPGVSHAAIDREALVSRHNPINRRADVDGTLTVGNGGFAFGLDITGLQTFAGDYHRWGVPTETQSRWCWVTDANPKNLTLKDASVDFTTASGKVVAYPTRQNSAAGDWLRRNPRSHPLGQILLDYQKADGTPFLMQDVHHPEQKLDLWRGVVTSRYEVEGEAVSVTTVCDPRADVVAVRVVSSLVATRRLGVTLAFPRGHDVATKNTPTLDWSRPESHVTRLTAQTGRAATLEREVLGTHYQVSVGWTGGVDFLETSPHRYGLKSNAGDALEFVVGFTPRVGDAMELPSFQSVKAASAAHWERFWREGAAVDFSGSEDARAAVIENRVVLSRYLMAVQMAGDTPPQESGLTCNTWYGKHHSEMIWWHTAHFALWGNDALLEKNLDWFRKQLPAARKLAQERGLRGARWAKMTGPEMRESPGGNPLIVWNQPHMVYLSELLYRNQPGRGTLEKYRDLVQETAECMAAMVHFDETERVYHLGPPLWIAQEIYEPATSRDPSYELAYWRWALQTAQEWRQRLGMERDGKWDHIIGHLARLPQKDGKYVALGSDPDTWDNIDSRHDHPTMLAPLGILPGETVDRTTMERTLDAVLESWDWETKIWGWDYPMIAMTAARLGRPETAVEILLRDGPNNRYLANGHCPQRSDEAMPKNPPPGARKREIAVYLPANGAFLTAVAMMAAGWDGRSGNAPGFPKDGKWKIEVEGLKPLP